MTLGFLTAPFGRWPLEGVARWAKENGFEALEVCCRPPASGDARRYAGVMHVDVDAVDDAGAAEIRSLLEREDRTFEGSEELVARGFHLARDVLRAYVT